MSSNGHRGLRYAPGLDGIRALAVLSVFVYHLGTTGDGEHILRGGFLGVDVFFVLSGYLITSLLLFELRETGRISIKQFYLRRARRLLPALYVLMLVVGIIGAVWLPQQAGRLRGDLLASLGYVTNWWLIARDASYFGDGDRPALLTHLWSLAVEEQFYVLWPLVLILCARWLAPRNVLLTLLTVGIIASTVAAALLFDPWGDPSRVYYGTDTRAATPLIGATLAVLLRPWRQRELTNPQRVRLDALGFSALAALGVVAYLLGDNDPLLYQGGFMVIALLAAMLVAAAGHPGSRLGAVLGRQPLRWLGERSYAVYLWHWPVCVLTRPEVDVPVTGWANAALRLVLSLALAELSFWLVERPLRRGGVFRFRAPRARHAIRPPQLRLAGVRAIMLTLALVAGSSAIGWQLTAAAAREGSAGDIVVGGDDVAIGPLTPAPVVNPSAGAIPSATPSPLNLPPPRITIFGDSQGTSLFANRPTGLEEYAEFSDASISGCSILGGKVVSRSGERRDLSGSCPNWVAHWTADAQHLQPEIALVLVGAWEMFDLITPHGVLVFGTPEWDANFSAALDKGIQAIRSSGATVALSLLPCWHPIRAGAGLWPERGDADRMHHLNGLLKAAAAANAAVYTVDPPTEFCTDPEIGTSKKYRWDGLHFFKPGAALYCTALLPQLLRLQTLRHQPTNEFQ